MGVEYVKAELSKNNVLFKDNLALFNWNAPRDVIFHHLVHTARKLDLFNDVLGDNDEVMSTQR